MGNTVLATLAAEFADLDDVAQWTRMVVRLGLAVILGAAIGYERESRDKAAGLRTHMLVALGSALFAFVAERIALSGEGMSRIIQGVITGIGFLGAGTVIKLRDQGKVRGLTTAAGIWATSAIGVAAGLGLEVIAIACTGLVFVILAVLVRLETQVDGAANAERPPPHDDDGEAAPARQASGR